MLQGIDEIGINHNMYNVHFVTQIALLLNSNMEFEWY